MVMPYQETPEDRLLIDKPYRTWNGTKLDIRWAGGWLTPEGEYFPIDYKNGITHATIATENGNTIIGSGSIATCPPIIRTFAISKWMRITYFEYSSFCVEFEGSLIGIHPSRIGIHSSNTGESKRRRQKALLKFIQDFSGFEEYFLNNTKHYSFREFKTAIARNCVSPRST